MKIAIVYDWIDKWGGVERLLLALHHMFPDAPFYTSYYDQKKAVWAKNIHIHESFMKRLPNVIKKNRILSIPFYPFAFETLDFNEYDIVISVSSSFAKGIITLPSTKHINICLTPTRFLWQHKNSYFTSKLLDPYAAYLMRWDYDVAQRPDHIIAISKTVQIRIKETYHRDSEVIYPPFDSEYWKKINSEISHRHPRPASPLEVWRSGDRGSINIDSRLRRNDNYFLVVSRLEPYKNVELVLRLFKQSKHRNLIIVGDGTQFQSLQQYKSSNITFLKHATDEELAVLYSQAEALIMPQVEDFGLVALEAQFFGCPIISYSDGGATETVIANKTGIFFDDQSVDSLKNALQKYDRMGDSLKKNTKEVGVKQCEKFETSIFEMKLKTYIQTIK